MYEKYKLNNIIIAIANSKKIELTKPDLKNLLQKNIIGNDDKFRISNSVHQDPKTKNPFYKNSYALTGCGVDGLQLIYFGHMCGRYETTGPVTKQRSVMRYYPSEFLLAENQEKVIRIGRYNDYVNLDIRDKDIEKAEIVARGYAYKIDNHPEFNEVHCYKREVRSEAHYTLEDRLDYAQKFLESLLKQ